MPGVKIRAATPRDHAAVRALYPELGVPEPMPDQREWSRELMPETLVAEDRGRVVGYALFKVIGVNGHVVQVVVAGDRRRAGVGAALMHEIARRLRVAGCSCWHLNVKEDNAAARALYTALGLEVMFAAQSVQIGAQAIAALPPLRGVRVAVAPDTDVPVLETRFGLSAGALLRRKGVTLRADLPGRVVGVARVSPALALAAPFRLRDHRAARPFFEAMQRWIDVPAARVVIEADAKLTELLCGKGAVLEMRLVHMEGKLK